MNSIKLLIILVLSLSIWSCKEEPKEIVKTNNEHVTTFYFIRHAEKDRTYPEDKDPELNQEGLGRAIRWAEILDPVDLDAIYISNFERTAMTAAPVSIKKDISPQYYDPHNVNIKDFMNRNLDKNVLIVGHSNTIPQFVNGMLGEEKYHSMEDYDNSSLFIVRVIDGIATDIRLKMD
ncbi:SixA phosphatase family protein [Arenibacter latericius]|uniref:SixA phosphatase family protein n=1 Tax=Arenibacter latericius TaxID=86104 RepID=UPI00041C5C92|nr:phosphoglycerate mutase family protein [Arenibacter latericius]MDX1363584.1 phosphoglycerate mutase family protein [Arenibacter latericius]